MLSEVHVVERRGSVRATRPDRAAGQGPYCARMEIKTGGMVHAGIAGPDGFPGIACIADGCPGTMRLDWRDHPSSGRLIRRLACPDCRMILTLSRSSSYSANGPCGHWLPDGHARRHNRAIPLSEHQLQLLIFRIRQAATVQAGAVPRTAEQVLDQIPADLLELRALAMIEWPGLENAPNVLVFYTRGDELCPHCGGNAVGLTCRLCLGFQRVPIRLANWYKRACAGLHGRSDSDYNADPLEASAHV